MHQLIADLEAAVESKLTESLAALNTPGPRSTGHKSKQRVAMNAITHGLSGQNVFLTADELPAYLRMGADFIADIRPLGVRETQLAQKVIDGNWRLNRLAAIENNLLNSALLNSIREGRTADDKLEGMVAQSDGFRDDCSGANAFEKLGRYEARLSRTLARVSEELERLQMRRTKHKEDTFVLSDCKAWLWYSEMVRSCDKLSEARASEVTVSPAAETNRKSAVAASATGSE